MVQMDRRFVAPVLLAALLLAAPAAGDPGSEKARVDEQLGELRDRAQDAGDQAGVLTSELASLSDRARSAEREIATEQAELEALEAELAARRATLESLQERIADQTARLVVLGRQHRIAVGLLEHRVREIYMSDRPDALSFVLGTDSWSDVLDNLELLQRIGRQDKDIVARVDAAERSLTALRAETRRDRAEAAEAERLVAARAEDQRDVRDRVLASRDALVAAEREKNATLASVREDKEHFLHEVGELELQSAELAARIQAEQEAAQAAPAPTAAAGPTPVQTPSAGGFIWPVDGTFVSGFGMRWGRMHQGVDITAPSGAPVVAVASGTVYEVGWHGGFGNLVVIDHGGGLQTYYAHNSSFAVSAGQTVGQGQVISYVGSTGNSSGPHVHLEVHVNGVPVDPLGYL